MEHYTHAPQKTESRACLLVLSIHFHKHFLSARVPVHFSRFLAKLLLANSKHSCQRFVTSKNALVHLIRFSAHSAFAAFLVVVYRTLSDFICTSGGHQPTQWRNAWQVSTSQFEEGFSNGFLFGELFKKFKQVRRRCLYSDSFDAAHPVVIAFPSGISSRIYGHDLLIMFV